jgi:hypothetical protein
MAPTASTTARAPLRRTAAVAAALACNAVIVALALLDGTDGGLGLVALGLPPAALLPLRSHDRAFRWAALALTIAYVASAIVFFFPLIYLPAALCLLVAALL